MSTSPTRSTPPPARKAAGNARNSRHRTGLERRGPREGCRPSGLRPAGVLRPGRHATASRTGRIRTGRIRAGGIERDVTFAPADEKRQDVIDAACHAKYDRYGPLIVGLSEGRERPRVLRRHPIAPHGSDARPARRVAWRLRHRSVQREPGRLRLRSRLRVGMMPAERFAMWEQRSLPIAVGTRLLELPLRSDHRAVRDRRPSVDETGGRHLEARSASIRSATASISSRSASSASRAATSAANSWLRRRWRTSPSRAARIASDWVRPVDSKVRRALSASSSSRTEIALATPDSVSRYVRQPIPNRRARSSAAVPSAHRVGSRHEVSRRDHRRFPAAGTSTADRGRRSRSAPTRWTQHTRGFGCPRGPGSR